MVSILILLLLFASSQMSGVGQHQFPNHDYPLVVSAGREISCRDRVYNNGAAHSFELKVEVGITYQEMVAHGGGGLPNYTAIADIHRVDPGFVKKVESELFVHGRVLSPEEIRANADRPIGPGSQTVCDHELFIIMMLYYQNPSRSIRSYRDHIILLTGNQVSLDTIHRVILGGFPYKSKILLTFFIFFLSHTAPTKHSMASNIVTTPTIE